MGLGSRNSGFGGTVADSLSPPFSFFQPGGRNYPTGIARTSLQNVGHIRTMEDDGMGTGLNAEDEMIERRAESLLAWATKKLSDRNPSDAELILEFRRKAIDYNTLSVGMVDDAEIQALAAELERRGYDPKAIHPTELEIAEAVKFRFEDDVAGWYCEIVGAAREMTSEVRSAGRQDDESAPPA